MARPLKRWFCQRCITHTCTHAHTHTHTHTHTCMHTQTSSHKHTHTCTHTHTPHKYKHTHVQTHACTTHTDTTHKCTFWYATMISKRGNSAASFWTATTDPFWFSWKSFLLYGEPQLTVIVVRFSIEVFIVNPTPWFRVNILNAKFWVNVQVYRRTQGSYSRGTYIWTHTV